MAKFNEILVGRYNRYLQKLFGMKGGPPAPQLSSEIQPSFELFAGRENRYLEGWRTFRVALLLGPTVGQTEAIQLRNPAGSNVIAVLESLAVFAAAGGTAQNTSLTENFVATQTDLTNAGSGASMDQRWQGVTGSTLIVSTSAGGAGDLAVTLASVPAPILVLSDLIQFEDQEIPILPSTTIRLRQGAANTQVNGILAWRERFLEESERT